MPDVMTATGPVPPENLGVLLPHEHVFINLMREYRGDGLLNNYDLAVSELNLLAAAGGRTVVDCTTRGLRPDYGQAATAASAAGVQLIFGCGYYRDPYLEDQDLDERDADELAADLVLEIKQGFDGTGLRPGIIGEVGSDKWYLSAREERSFRAAARAHLESGLTITTHAARWPVGMRQLDLLSTEGVAPSRVIIGHCDMVPDMEYHLALAQRGAYVQFDTIRRDADYELNQRVAFVRHLVDHGFEDRILLSHDVCLRSHLSAMGGGGYAYILRDFLPRLEHAGLSAAVLEKLIRTNPQRALAGE